MSDSSVGEKRDVSYRIVKTGRRYSILNNEEPIEILYRLPSAKRTYPSDVHPNGGLLTDNSHTYPATDLTANELLLAVVGLHLENPGVINFDAPKNDQTAYLAKCFSMALNQRCKTCDVAVDLRKRAETAESQIGELETMIDQFRRILKPVD
jgi:hypothetical protein